MVSMFVKAILLPFVMAFIATKWIFPKTLNIALEKNIVDNPNARKLQRTPVPILGGLTIFFGMAMGIACSMLFGDYADIFPVVVSMILILLIGTMDDIIDLSPTFRFAVEILIVLILIFSSGASLNDFHGLWGFYEVPMWFSLMLTIIAAVGMINAINLIDGIDGLSSGFCIMASSLFGIMFYFAGNSSMLVLAAVSIGALIPFFFHNVFGRTSKMFIGDGGTLLMGIILSTFVIRTLTHGTSCASLNPNLGLIPFTIAVMSIPVFDTLRVMSIRMLRGKSPFSPDKTHLHHLFIEMGFSHIGATVSILTFNTIIVACWWLSYRLGCSIEWQLYIVLILAVAMTFVFYKFMKIQQKYNTSIWRMMRVIGKVSHIERKGIFLWLQNVMDGDKNID